jgi:hypothetical protein
MRTMNKRLTALEEAANPEGEKVWVWINQGWDRDLTLEHFRRSRDYHKNPVPEGAQARPNRVQERTRWRAVALPIRLF